jgi:hypothetical protein
MEQDNPPARDRIERLRKLNRALRQAHGLSRRAIDDYVGDDLYRARCSQRNISLVSATQMDMDKDGSSILTRVADEIKQMVEALATLEAMSRVAVNNIKPSKTGRPALLDRDCIQGLARVYRCNTGTRPGRGSGPFANFVSEFMAAVGQTGFRHASLIDAIQDAHRRSKPSWFDGKPPSF